MLKIETLKENPFPIPRLTTERLILRPCLESDFDAINQYAQLPEVYRFIRPPDGDKPTHDMIASLVKDWAFEETKWQGLIINFGSDKAIGELVFRVDDKNTKRVEIGYRLSPGYAGKGIVSEAIYTLIEYLFEQFDIHKLVARCDPRNVASYKIMEKMGMQKEAHFKSHYLNGDEMTDQLDYAILREEWNSQQNS